MGTHFYFRREKSPVFLEERKRCSTLSPSSISRYFCLSPFSLTRGDRAKRRWSSFFRFLPFPDRDGPFFPPPRERDIVIPPQSKKSTPFPHSPCEFSFSFPNNKRYSSPIVDRYTLADFFFLPVTNFFFFPLLRGEDLFSPSAKFLFSPFPLLLAHNFLSPIDRTLPGHRSRRPFFPAGALPLFFFLRDLSRPDAGSGRFRLTSIFSQKSLSVFCLLFLYPLLFLSPLS